MSRLTTERALEIYAATLDLVATRGFASTTIDAIAERAHCSKATIYRQWDGKVSLLVEAMAALKPEPVELPDTGSLVGDLHALMTSGGMSHLLDSSRIVVAILHAAQQDDELRDALRARIGGEHRGPVKQILDRAVARGEIAPDLPAARYLPLMFLAPVVLQPLLPGETLDASSMTDYIDATLIPLLGLSAD